LSSTCNVELMIRGPPEPRTLICRKRDQSDGLIFVGECAGLVIGTILAGYDGVRGWIYSLAVAESHRRQGVGRWLLEAVEGELALRGCPKVNLQVRGTNRDVLAFYERCGYAIEDRASLGKPLETPSRDPVEPVPEIRVADDILLSQPTWEDQPAYLKHLNQTEAFRDNMGVMPYPYTELDARQWLSRVMRQTLDRDKARQWAIRESGGHLIGGIGLMGLSRNQKAELGYWLAQPFWGRGIVTQAVKSLCQFAFEEYQLRKIYSRVFGGNTASARVLEKAGFIREATLKDHVFRNGTARDLLWFGLFNPRIADSLESPSP
jgi:RimJ/RimL family protein N-acetyltransferase